MFRLALELGKTVGELERTLTSTELVEWMALYELEPFGAWRDNYHAAMQASLLLNINRGRNSAPSKISDFMYRDRDSQREKDTSCFMAGLKLLAKKDG